jgi:5,10-methylenetetrahydromethanopterin reductase
VPLSLGLFPTSASPTVLEQVALAESLGYEKLYLGDSQLIWRELLVLLGALAVTTSRIQLGSGVTNPITRDWTVLAGAWATLDELSGGRVFVGLGVGDSAVRTMGQKPTSLAELERAVHFLRTLYAGGSFDHQGTPVRLGYREAGRRVPVVLAANKTRMVQLAARAADGLIWSSGMYLQYVLSETLENLRIGAAEAGRDLSADGFRVIHWLPCSVNANGDRARDAVRGQVARRVRSQVPAELPPRAHELVERLRREYDWYDHMASSSKHAELVPDWLIELYAVAGTPRECREQLERLLALPMPVDEIALVPHGPTDEARAETIRLFMQEVAR